MDTGTGPESQEAPACRICFGGGVVRRGWTVEEDGAAPLGTTITNTVTASDRLFSPCACAGSVAYVHERCLEKWRRQVPAPPEDGGPADPRRQARNYRRRCPQCRVFYRFARAGGAGTTASPRPGAGSSATAAAAGPLGTRLQRLGRKGLRDGRRVGLALCAVAALHVALGTGLPWLSRCALPLPAGSRAEAARGVTGAASGVIGGGSVGGGSNDTVIGGVTGVVASGGGGLGVVAQLRGLAAMPALEGGSLAAALPAAFMDRVRGLDYRRMKRPRRPRVQPRQNRRQGHAESFREGDAAGDAAVVLRVRCGRTCGRSRAVTFRLATRGWDFFAGRGGLAGGLAEALRTVWAPLTPEGGHGGADSGDGVGGGNGNGGGGGGDHAGAGLLSAVAPSAALVGCLRAGWVEAVRGFAVTPRLWGARFPGHAAGPAAGNCSSDAEGNDAVEGDVDTLQAGVEGDDDSARSGRSAAAAAAVVNLVPFDVLRAAAAVHPLELLALGVAVFDDLSSAWSSGLRSSSRRRASERQQPLVEVVPQGLLSRDASTAAASARAAGAAGAAGAAAFAEEGEAEAEAAEAEAGVQEIKADEAEEVCVRVGRWDAAAALAYGTYKVSSASTPSPVNPVNANKRQHQ